MEMKDEERFNGKDLDLEESLELCEDIYKYYEKNPERSRDREREKRREEEEKATEIEKEVIVEKDSFVSQILFFAISIVIAVFLSKLINGSLIQETRVDGNSMYPTLYHKERLFLNKFSNRNKEYERFDIVVFSFNNGEHFVKRIIGLPGEKVQIINGEIYIDDVLLADDPIKDKIEYAGIAEEGIYVGNHEYFVIGDNRNHSYDSRFEEIGPISNKVITGKVWFRFFPISRIGVVK